MILKSLYFLKILVTPNKQELETYWTIATDHANMKILLPAYVDGIDDYGKVCVVTWDDSFKGLELSCTSTQSCPQSTDTFKVAVKHVVLDKTSKYVHEIRFIVITIASTSIFLYLLAVEWSDI